MKTKNNKYVAVFGGSAPNPGEPAYEAAQRLGVRLGRAGYTVLTGGYMGTMEATSRGAAETGGHVIGVTCDEIEAWRPVGPNAWVMEEIRFQKLHQRLIALIENCDAAIALPGGIGTLAEITVMWSGMQTGGLPLQPLILVGSGWHETLMSLFGTSGDYVPEKYRKLITFAPNVDKAFEILQEAFKKEGNLSSEIK